MDQEERKFVVVSGCDIAASVYKGTNLYADACTCVAVVADCKIINYMPN